MVYFRGKSDTTKPCMLCTAILYNNLLDCLREEMFDNLLENYQARRNQLMEKLNASSNPYLVSVIGHSIIVSDISIELITTELPDLMGDFLDYHHKSRERFDNIAERAEKVSQNAAALKKQYGDDFDASIGDLALKHTKATMQNIALVNEIEIDSFQSSIDLIIKTLNNYLIAENRRDIEEAFGELLKFLAGLTPVGPLLSLHESIQKIRGTYNEDEKKANSTLNEYDKYLEKLYLWNILAQTIVERFKALTISDEHALGDEEIAEIAKKAVEARFDAKLTKQHE